VGFQAEGDLIGRRIRIAWEFWPEGDETLAEEPRVQLRRKRHDFEYVAAVPDPSLVYDSGLFPPADPALVITELPGWEDRLDGARRLVSAISVGRSLGGRLVEIARRIVTDVVGDDGRPVRRRVEIVDLGGQPDALQPGETYYYRLFSPAIPAAEDPAPYQATAAPAENYGLGRTLYEMLPQIYRRHDVIARPSTPGDDSIPEMAGRSGQLRRMVDLFGTALSSFRSSAEGLKRLHDVDEVDARYLPLLARWIGWQLDQRASPARHRNEIKTAGRLYRTTGTVPGLRALITQYTGWSTQVAEMAQHILRANQAPRYNLFASVERDGRWEGADDASGLLGLGPDNDEASGTGSAPAALTGTASGPFALFPGATLTLSVDGGLPSTIRFQPGDFRDMGAATAAEVAAALSAAHDELVATAAAGRLHLATKSAGPSSSLRVSHPPSSLLSLEGAPGGRLSAFIQGGRARLFFEARTSSAPSGEPQDGRLLYVTWADGAWRPARAVPGEARPARGAPAAAPLPDGRILLAWLDAPGGGAAQIRFALGQPRPPQPARLHGSRRGPFALLPGTRLAVAGTFGPTELFTVIAGDYANPAQATTAEVATAINRQLSKVEAAPAADGSLRLETTSTGDAIQLRVDLSQSTAARALGFGPGPAGPTHGHFDDEIDWGGAGWMPELPPGHHAELSAAWDEAVGGVRLAWASHQGGPPSRVWIALWTGRTAFATAAGAALRDASGAVTVLTTSSGLPSNDVRATALDADGTLAFATAAGAALRRPNGTTAVMTTAIGLPSNDVRDAAFEPQGGLWLATAGGAALRRSTGAIVKVTTQDGIPSNDVRRVAVEPGGDVWLATAGGLARWRTSGTVDAFTPGSSALPSPDVRAVAVDRDGAAWAATAGGLAIVRGGAVERVSGLHSDDIRSIAFEADGTPVVGTGAGIALRRADGSWEVRDTTHGLPSNDVRGVWTSPTSELWVATPAGAAIRDASGAFQRVGTASGLPSADVRHLSGVWSAPRVASSAGTANREPCLQVDSAGRAWLLWSRRQGTGPEDTWTVRQRMFTPGSYAWSAEAAVTTPPGGGGRAADREPVAMPGAGGGSLRVFFRSDRSGSEGLYWLPLSSTGVPGAIGGLPADGARDRAPVPLRLPDGKLWLVYRSDRNVALAQAAAAAPPFSPARSARLPDPGAIRRYAGSTTAVLEDLNRNRRRRAFGDLLAYTPQKPRGPPEERLTDTDVYTRETIGLYLTRGKVGNEITPDEVARLRSLLERFLPINARPVLIVTPEPVVEVLYPSGADILESSDDKFPVAEVYPGPITDATAAALSGWDVLHSNERDEVSMDPDDPSTLRRRTYYPPPE
jgi:phage tail-like protein